MRGILEGIRSFSDELTRRRVYRAGAWYLGGAFVAIQVADILFEALGFAPWLLTLVVLLAITGFPVVLVLAWIFELSAEGLRRADPTVLPGVPGLHALFGGAVIVLSVGMAGASWWLWLDPQAGPPAAEPAAAAEAGDPRRIAVLYFDDHSSDGSLGYLADGLTEGLIHELAGVEGLMVTSRNGVKRFRDGGVPLDSIVHTLGVGSIVEGSVASSGDSVLVTVQLIDASTGDHLTSGQVRAPLTDLLDLQRSVSEQVARVLRRHLGREVRLREHRAGATSSEAWSLVQRAQRLMEDDYSVLLDRDEAGVRRTLDRVDSLLARASRLDPRWAEPVYRQGLVAEHRAGLDISSTGGLDAAEAARALRLAAAAAALDGSDGRPWALQGRIRRDLVATAPADSAARLRARAEEDFRLAVDRSPDLAEAWADLSDLLIDQGRHAEARQAALRALRADAFLEAAPDVAHHLFDSSLNLKDFDEARRWCEEGRTRYTSDHRFVLCGLFLLVSHPSLEPDVSWAWSLVDSLGERLNPSARPSFRRLGAVQVAKVAVRAGLADSARAILREHGGDPPPTWLAYDVAHLYLLLGEPDEVVLGLLETYLEAQPSMRGTLARDWWFEGLHDDPRFAALVDGPD